MEITASSPITSKIFKGEEVSTIHGTGIRDSVFDGFFVNQTGKSVLLEPLNVSHSECM